MKNKKILITGGSGLLGQELLKVNPEIIAPSHTEYDVTNIDNILYDTQWYKPNTIIHCAALLDGKIIDKHPDKAIETNIVGTANLAITCIKLGIRLIYLSTDYVYKGTKGNYCENDELFPFNFYAWTKLGGEAAVKGVKDHLIIRTSFSGSECKYPAAYNNIWRSREYVDKIAPMIYEASISPLQGVLNLGGTRKTPFQYAVERNPDIELSNGFSNLPYDTSLNLTKWKNYKNGTNM